MEPAKCVPPVAAPVEWSPRGEQVAIRYPTLEQRGERRGEQRGIHKTQMAYVREMHGPAAAAAMENFLARLPVRPALTFRDLNDLAAVWKNDRDLAVWWARHRSDLQDHEGVEVGDRIG